MTNNTTARALRTTVVSALIVIATGLGAQASWAVEAGDSTASTVTASTTEDTSGPSNPNNPWD